MKFLINKSSLYFFICLTLFSLPLYLLRCNKASICPSPIPFTLLELLILITFFLWFFQKYQRKRNIRKIIEELRNKIPLILQIFFVIFLFSALVSVLVSSQKISALGFFKAYFVEPFLLFLVIIDTLNNETIHLVFWSLFSSSFWVGLLTISEKVFGFSPFNLPEFLARGRVSAVYQTSNAVGLLLGPLVVVLIGYLFQLKSENSQRRFFNVNEMLLGVVTLCVLIVGIFFSGSRGALLGVIASTIFFFGFLLYKKMQKIWKNIIKNVFIILTLSLFIFNFSFLFNINSVIKVANKSDFYPAINLRLCLWQSTINIIKEKPIFGTGLGGFSSENNSHHTCSQESTTYPHNILLNFWAETGIFGLVSFIAICSWFFFKLLESDKLNLFNVGLAGYFVSVLFHGLVDVPYLKNDLSVLFWVVLAIGLYLINRESLFIVKVLKARQQ